MTIKCVPNIKPSAEKCNGLDDDCDGTVDNPDAPGLCDQGYVCSQGQCIPPCNDSEFPCSPPTRLRQERPALQGSGVHRRDLRGRADLLRGDLHRRLRRTLFARPARSAASAIASTRAGASPAPRPRFATTAPAFRPAHVGPAPPVRPAPAKGRASTPAATSRPARRGRFASRANARTAARASTAPPARNARRAPAPPRTAGPSSRTRTPAPPPAEPSEPGDEPDPGPAVRSESGGEQWARRKCRGPELRHGRRQRRSPRRNPELLVRRDRSPPRRGTRVAAGGAGDCRQAPARGRARR